MPGQGQNRWVVLLNRSPKGPLTEEEVKTLLENGILRANDIAYLVSDTEKGKSEWKLLWQFPEFNRRQPQSHNPDDKNDSQKPPSPPGGRERRQKTPPEEIHKQALSDLPPDLMDISPEDLLPRSTAVAFKPEPAQISPINDETLLQDKPETPPASAFGLDLRYLFGAGVLAMLVFAVVKLPGLLRSTTDKGGRALTGQKNIDALQPDSGKDHPPQLSPSQITVHPQSKSRGLPMQQNRLPPPPSPREREPESNYDSPAPPPENEEPPPMEEPSEPIEENQPALPSGPRSKNFRPRQPTTEEEGGGGSPAVESVPASEDVGPELDESSSPSNE